MAGKSYRRYIPGMVFYLPRRYRHGMTPTQFKAALRRLGYTWEEAAAEFGVNPRTLARWASGESAVPGPVVRLITCLEWAGKATKRRR